MTMPGPGADQAFVLLVDDDEDLRLMIGELLRDQGWRVAEADSGEAAIAIAKTDPPDVIVTDQRMPGLSGSELILALRDTGVLVPAILITAARDAASIAGAIDTRCYLTKPFSSSALLVLVSRALSGQC